MRSRVENHFDPDNVSSVSSLQGIVYASFLVTWFSLWQSTQNRAEPSFFLTITIGEAQGLADDWMMSCFNMSCISWWTSFKWAVGICLGGKQTGWFVSVVMVCCNLSVPIQRMQRHKNPLRLVQLFLLLSGQGCSTVMYWFPQLLFGPLVSGDKLMTVAETSKHTLLAVAMASGSRLCYLHALIHCDWLG